ncbi:hypothetical protein EW026_g6884 [Hermanssonia centrifuga]|uniref:Uncharacterized protein n=1 Tax=Hermanssonia centrifuga TaxID=98765 RepID=A0A4S4K9M6_9APHY|nr:hypothetical protein EW026_g6884 [Hermanssonia centrifuga]
MELLGHRKTFVFWLACCTGKDPLISFFHKPKLLILHGNRIIRDPYPLTRFCEVPVEDKTNYPLCRVLPVEHFPRLRVATPETRARSSPVGSDAWVAAKSGLLASSAWAKGPPKSKAKIVGPSISPALGVGSASAAVSPRLDTNRGRGPQFLQVPNIYAPTPELAAPPGLSRLHTNLSATSLSIPGWEIPPILSRGPSAVGSSGSSGVDSIRATPIAQESPDVQIAGEGLEETMPGFSLYDEREDDLWTMGVPVGVSIEPAADQMLPNLWEDYGKKKPEISKEDIVCQVHGKICAKGICKQRKAQEVEKRQREAERAQRNKVVKPSGWRTASNKGGELTHPYIYSMLKGIDPARVGLLTFKLGNRALRNLARPVNPQYKMRGQPVEER